MENLIRPRILISVWALALLAAPSAHAIGIFAPAAGQAGSTAIAAGDPSILGWATTVLNYTPGTDVDLQFQTPLKALGPAGNSDGASTGFNFDIVSLGNRGAITLGFDSPIANGPGYDFAVFENSFSDTFLELAWVEVSSDGSSFFRFPGFSLTPGPVNAFGSMDPTNLEGLAGKYRGGFATPFDLEWLAGTPGLDLTRVSYVRLVDIVGDASAANDLNPASLAAWLGLDSAGALPDPLLQIALGAPVAIFDPYPTVGSAGFDLDAIAVLNVAAVPLPASVWLLMTGLAALLGRRRLRAGLGAAVASMLWLSTASATVITFADLTLPPDSWFDPNVTTTFTSGGATFFHDAPFGDCCWSGFSYSNRGDTTTPGFMNDSSAISGSGVGEGQDTYAIGQADGARLEFGSPTALRGAFFTNTTYAYLAMRDGNDGNQPAFVKGPFGEGDFFTLTVTGRDNAGQPTGSVDIPLAVGSVVLSDWTWFDLSALGVVQGLVFSFTSSDSGIFGVNTPVYFAMDNLAAVPAPAAVWLLATGLVAFGFAARRGRVASPAR